MISRNRTFPKNQAEMDRLGSAIKQKALAQAAKFRELDETDADDTNWEPGRVRTTDSYVENGARVSITENLTFDPATNEIEKYHYSKYVKLEDEDGQAKTQQYNLTIDKSNGAGWMLGNSRRETPSDFTVGEYWSEDGVNFNGADDFISVVKVAENGLHYLETQTSKSGEYGSGKQQTEGFLEIT